MKNFLELFVLVSFVLISCSQPSPTEEGSRVKISGEVLGYQEDSPYQSLIIIVHSPFRFSKGVEHTVYLNDEGKFNFEVQEFFPHEYVILFKEHISLYAHPGDSLYIKFAAGYFENDSMKYGDVYDFIRLSGTNTPFNENLFAFKKYWYSNFWNLDTAYLENSRVKELSPEEYHNHIEARTRRYENGINRFKALANTTVEFDEYLSNRLKFQKLNDLMRYPWLHPYLNKINPDSLKLPEKYFSFLDEVDFNNKDKILSNDAIRFLREYAKYSTHDNLPNDKNALIKKLGQERNQLEIQNIVLDHILHSTKDYEQQLLLTFQFNMILEWNFIEIFDSLYQPDLFSIEPFANMLEEESRLLHEHLENPATYTDIILADLKMYNNNVLSSIIKKYKGKVIYIDFWAPWCHPCLDEIKFSHDLHERYSEDEVVFIYLANRCSEKSWKMTVKERKIKGKHHLLRDNEFKSLADKFEISGIPHYVLINKEGHIVDPNAPRPSSSEKLTSLLDSLIRG